MQYLNKTFSVSMANPKSDSPKRKGVTTYVYCAPCQKVHEVGTCKLKAKRGKR